MTVYRACDEGYAGPEACYAESREAAEAYLDNPGFGGRHLWEVHLAEGTKILDLTDRDWKSDLSEQLGMRDEWGYPDRDPWFGFAHAGEARENILDLDDELVELGFTHIRYVDDYPADCVTICRIAPGNDSSLIRPR